MARVTVEDCIDKVNDHFDLVLIAAQRAKQISAGNPLTVERNNDKDSVVSLREIAEETVNPDELREDVVKSFLKYRSEEPREMIEDEVDAEVEAALKEATEIPVAIAQDAPLPPSEDAGEPTEAEINASMAFGSDDVEVND